MNKRFVGVLLFAFVVASGASLLLYRLLINRPAAAKTAAPVTAKVVLAARDLDVGTVLKEEDVKLTDWAGAVPTGAIVKVQDAVGRGVTTAMYGKEPIIESRLAPKGAGGGLASMIPPGMRAVAIRVNDVVGVAGFVVPGMRVDILISGQKPGGDGNLGTVTKTLLQNIEVLSAGQDIKKDNEGKPIMVGVVNLLVTPDQAEQLSLASSSTSIQLVLRNPLDRNVAKTNGTAVRLLFDGTKLKATPDEGGEAAPAPPRRTIAAIAPPVPRAAPVPKEAPFVMEIISGTKKSDITFNNPGGSSK